MIGRSPAAQIQIPGRFNSVSRRHAEVWHDGESVWIHDLGSRGGTRINGIWLRCLEPAMMVVGDRLTLGGAELRLEPVFPRKENIGRKARPPGQLGCDDDTLAEEPAPQLAAQALLERLTFAEHNLVLWMGRGYIHDEELSALMHRSPHTVRTQISSILKKLKLRSRACILNQLQREAAAIRITRSVRSDHLP